ncbi:MAG TPA: DUF456 domain-containing protein [Phycicoccus sp.]|nr:DUF456 domain-containing protein [Phycicoccus sp.]
MDPPTDDVWLIIPPLLIVVGLVGIVVPALPGTVLVLGGMLVFALTNSSPVGWVLFSLSVLVAVAGKSLQYLLPGRRMKERGVRTSTLVLAVLLGVVGFFVIPVVGAVVGFVLGIFLVELLRGRDHSLAWTRTRHAVVAVAQSVGIELLAGLVVAALYGVGVVIT